MLKRLMRTMTGAGAPAPEITVAEAVRARATGKAQIVDVREADEWVAGHIPGALHIPLGDLGRRRSEVDADRPLITVCRSGRRSLIAADAFRKAGYADAASLVGGMIAWKNANQPVEQ